MRDPAKTFEDLVVWQKAHQFVLSRDLDYGDVSESKTVLVEVSKLLEVRGQWRGGSA
jgi:hypothetical protein